MIIVKVQLEKDSPVVIGGFVNLNNKGIGKLLEWNPSTGAAKVEIDTPSKGKFWRT